MTDPIDIPKGWAPGFRGVQSWRHVPGRPGPHAAIPPGDPISALLDDPARGLPSFLEETHRGGILEHVPGLDPSPALTDGYPHDILGGWAPAPLQPEAIFDVDAPWTRVPTPAAVPWRAICHLRMIYENGRSAEGTGWMAAPDIVITAGHNVFSHQGHGWATGGIEVSPGRDGQVTHFPVTEAAEIDAFPGWAETLDPARDLGVIRLRDPDLGRRTGWFGILDLTDADLAEKPLIHSAGYPGHVGRTQWMDQGRVGGFSTAFLRYRLDSVPGQSGSPIFMRFRNGQRRVVATHVYGDTAHNLGRRLTGPAFEVVRRWIGMSATA